MCIASHPVEVSDFLSYDMPQKFLCKIIQVLNKNTDEWLHLMNEPGAALLHIYLKDERIHFAAYGLSVDSTELNEDEEADRDKCEECWFDVDVDIQNVVDGIVTEFSLYENGNGLMLYEKHWDVFPAKEFAELKEYAFQLQEKAEKYNRLLCTTFLKRDDMEYLEEFKKRVSLVDGMLIETGGQFGKRYLQNYIEDCVEIAQKYYEDTKDKNNLMEIVNFYIAQYETQVSWKYYQYEMKFLEALKAAIMKL